MTHERLMNYIVIDDDTLNNMVSKKVIELTVPGAAIFTFVDGEKGLEHIRRLYAENNGQDCIIFLNVNMPALSGWDVLDVLQDMPEHIKSRIHIYMLSSSAFPEDIRKAATYTLVSDYLDKPLSKTKLEKILNDF